jgi:2-dehydro-3-deoxy-D-gluconate 5-dehydrogenase
MHKFELSGKTALVTGGASGLGLAMATALSQAGASLAIVGRNERKGRLATEILSRSGSRNRFFALNVCDEKESTRTVNEIVTEFGGIDILINNAGTTIRKRPQDLCIEEWRTVLDVNLTAAFIMARNVYPHMKRGGGGKIINISSVLAIVSAPFSAAYSASKAGLVQLTRTLAVAWAPENIQVNAILPGWMDTDLTREARQQVSDLHEHVISRTPARRWGKPDDIEGAAIFLASSASDFVTGAALPVDGGYIIQG